MNGLHFFFGVGAFLAPIIIGQVILLSGDINWGYWIIGLYAVPIAVWVIRLPSPTPQTEAREDQESAPIVPLVVLMVIFFFLYVGAEAGYGGWIYTYTITLGLGNVASAAYLTSMFWGSLTIGRLLAIPIAARLRPRTILFSDLVGCLISMGIILLFPSSILAIWIGTLGLGFSMASLFPTMLTFAERRMALSGQITRWFFVGAGLGGMTLPWLIGPLFETLGPLSSMYAILIDLLIALVVFFGMLRYSKD
jgi:FHS family Na+ dependent glucose MFS transporter 1